MRALGVVVSGSNVHAVCLDIANTPPTVIDDFTWRIRPGDRPEAYFHMFELAKNYVQEHRIGRMVLKASANVRQGTSLAHLHAAELRGIVATAGHAGGAHVRLLQKGVISRTFGDRKADEYLDDDAYWDNAIVGELKKIRREAALLVLSDLRAAGETA